MGQLSRIRVNIALILSWNGYGLENVHVAVVHFLEESMLMAFEGVIFRLQDEKLPALARF